MTQPGKKLFKRCFREGVSEVEWEFGGRWFRRSNCLRYNCRRDGRMTREPVNTVRGIRKPNRTIKADCCASITVNTFQVLPSEFNNCLEKDLREEEHLVFDIFVMILLNLDHNHVASGYLQKPHPEVHQIVEETSRVCDNIWKLRSSVEEKVISLLEDKGYPVDKENRMWFPTVGDIRNMTHMPGLEIEKIEKVIAECVSVKNANVHKCVSKEEEKILIVYQTPEQQEIMREHGEILFLDSTHKTNRYGLPLFMVLSYTPQGYQIVAFFISTTQDGGIIEEALKIIKDWNPNFCPLYSMTDICQAEINAIQAVFPSVLPFLCDFHVKQAWTKSINNHFKLTNIDPDLLLDPSYNNDEAKKTAEQLLLHLMYAEAPTHLTVGMTLGGDFEKRLAQTRKNRVLVANPGFSRYFEDWVKKKQMWAMPWRNNVNMKGIRTNNGIESLNNVVKNMVMDGKGKFYSLPQLLIAMTTLVIPGRLQTYRHKKAEDSSKYKKIVRVGRNSYDYPDWFNGIPSSSMNKIKDNLNRSKRFEEADVKELEEDGQFILRSSDGTGMIYGYKVNLKSDVTCTCLDFKNFSEIPCKHILGIIRIKEIPWESLPESFRLNPYLSVDRDDETCRSTGIPQAAVGIPSTSFEFDDVQPPSSPNPTNTPRSQMRHNPQTLESKALALTADLRTHIYNVDDKKKDEMWELVRTVLQDDLFPKLRTLAAATPVRPAIRTENIPPSISTCSKRIDVKDVIKKPAAKKRKQFTKYNIGEFLG